MHTEIWSKRLANGGSTLEAASEPFTLADFSPYLIARVGSLMEQTITPALKRAGLTIDMWRVLMVLRFNGPMTLVALSRHTGVTTSTLSRLIGRLVDQDLVSRRRSNGDTRTVQVRLRPKGQALFEDLWPMASRLEGLVTSGFESTALNQFKSALKSIETVLLYELESVGTTGGNR